MEILEQKTYTNKKRSTDWKDYNQIVNSSLLRSDMPIYTKFSDACVSLVRGSPCGRTIYFHELQRV